jgi:putative hydrolase of the HAD superfamily
MMATIRGLIFCIDDVLYDASLQRRAARLSAVKAMIEVGLPVDVETGSRVLEEIVREYGDDYNKHFDKLLEKLNLKWNSSVIAAGVVAYRETNPVYLRPYPDAAPTLVKLRDQGYKLGVASTGRAVKQWQKLIQMGVQHLFHSVVISEELGLESFQAKVVEEVLTKLGTPAKESIFVGAHPETEVPPAKQAGVHTVRLKRGNSGIVQSMRDESAAEFEIRKLSEIFEVVQKLQD